MREEDIRMDTKVLTEQPSLLPRDPVLDFIARVYGKPNAGELVIIEKNLRWMIEGFAACQGQFFLFVRRYQDSCMRSMGSSAGFMPPHDFSVTMTEIYLGIISGEFRFGEAGTPFRFPVQSPHAFGDMFQNPKLWVGNFFTPSECHGYEIMLFLKQPRQVSDIELPGLDMAIGDDKVKQLIRQYQNPIHKHYGEFPLLLPVYKMCALLGRYLTNFPEQAVMIQKSPELFGVTKRELKK